MSAMTQPAAGTLQIALRHIFHERGRPAFRLEVEFALPAGITILFGPSGSGKSTILECVAGLLRPDEGRIAAEGRVFFDSAQGVHLPHAAWATCSRTWPCSPT
jgi:molybdate transport system ATP-binding protein